MPEVLHIGRKGLTPQLDTAMKRLHEDLNDALDRAQESGVPVELVVGMLECTKGAVLGSLFDQMADDMG